MKFYESGDSSKPVIFLFPGTCCLYSSFDHILAKRLSRKSRKSMVEELKQRMGAPLAEVLYPF